MERFFKHTKTENNLEEYLQAGLHTLRTGKQEVRNSV